MIDTDVLIDAGRGVRDAVSCLDRIEHRALLAVSAITQMELIIGCRNKTEFRFLVHFLRRFQIFKLDARVSDIAVDLLGRYRLSHGLLIADALIAATALSLNVPFLTKNHSDYKFIAGMRLLPYPQLFAVAP